MSGERRFAVWMLWALALAGCTESVQGSSSETHFLALCVEGGCPDGQQCLCGVCTAPCDGDAACRGLSDEAQCLDLTSEQCARAAVCDVACDDSGDCEPLDGTHACEDGRCRGVAAAAEPATAGGCLYYGRSYTDGESFAAVDGCNTCSCEGGVVECTERPCYFDGVPLSGCEVGDATYADGERWMSECNECQCTDGAVACTRAACPPTIDEPPCEPGSCEIYGVCYPDGASSEDGCCGCAGGVASCIEPGWCPGRPDIGSRCGGAGDMGCATGLTCRTDFFGERAVCTRSCNYGCPTGTACVEQVPLYNEGVAVSMCLRTCQTQADCDFPAGDGTPSECDTVPGLDGSYCF